MFNHKAYIHIVHDIFYNDANVTLRNDQQNHYYRFHQAISIKFFKKISCSKSESLRQCVIAEPKTTSRWKIAKNNVEFVIKD